MAFTNPRGRTQSSLSEINITPFVDVVLVLLIIFMLTAPILESGIEVDLPKTKTVKIVSEEKVVITIDKKQNIYVGNDPVNIHRLGVTVLGSTQGRRHAAGVYPLRPERKFRSVRAGGGCVEASESHQPEHRYRAAGDQARLVV